MQEIINSIKTIFLEKLDIYIDSTDKSLVVLGASSMKLMQFVAYIFEEFNIIIELEEIIDNQTIDDIALLIFERTNTKLKDTIDNSTKNINKVEVSELQKPFWEMRHHSEGMISYNEAVSYRIKGLLDIKKCNDIASQIIKEQSSLRMKFVEINAIPYQEEINPESISFHELIEFQDISSSKNPFKYCNELFKIFFNEKFDLTTPPLFKIKIWKINNLDYVISCVIYHLIADLWSVDVITKRCVELYEHLNSVRELSNIKTVLHTPKYDKGTSYTIEDEQYWTQQLKLPLLDVNLSKNIRPAIKNYNGDMLIRKLDKINLEKLESFSKNLQITMSSLCFSAYFILISAISGNKDLIIGTPYLCRNHPANANSVGMFVNTLPIRVIIDKYQTTSCFLEYMHRHLLDAFGHGNYPIHKMIQKLSIPTILNRAPIFEELFTFYEKQQHKQSEENIFNVQEIELTRGKTKFDLTFFVTTDGSNISVKAEYSTTLFNGYEINDYVNAYEYILLNITNKKNVEIKNIIRHVENKYIDSYPKVKNI